MSGYGILPCCCGPCTGVCTDIPTLTFTADHTTENLTVTHNFNANDQVRLVTSGTLPAGLAALTPYYVIVVDSSTIQLSLTSGGSAVTFTDNGTGTHEITDTTWIEDSWGTEAELLARGWVLNPESFPEGGNPDPVVESRGKMCELVLSDTAAQENCWGVWELELNTPTGSGWVMEVSARIFSHPSENWPESSTVQVGANRVFGVVGTQPTAVVYGRPRATDGKGYGHNTTEGGSGFDSTTYVDGGRLTLRVTENGGNHDVESILTVGGTPTAVYTETASSAYSWASTVKPFFGCSDSGGWACWYCRLRNGT